MSKSTISTFQLFALFPDEETGERESLYGGSTILERVAPRGETK